MKVVRLFLAGCLFLGFFSTSCNQTPVKRKKIDFLKLKTSAQEKMKRLLLEGHPELPLSKKERESLLSIYKPVGFQGQK